MAAPLSKAPPPPPTAEQRAQRLRQRRLLLTTAGVLFVLLAAWQVYEYMASAEQRAEEQVQQGVRSLSPGHYEQAIQEFGQALDTDGSSWNAYFQRGVARENLEQFDAALADYQKALTLKPDLLAARVARAEIYRKKGDARRASEELTKVIELKPSEDAYFSRGVAYAELGEHQKAILDFTWVIDMKRDAPFAYFARAKSKRALGDVAGANLDDKTALTFDRGRVR